MQPIGYFRVVNPEPGYFLGGLLVVTDRGRPVEFHLSSPVVVNRAQQILFGDSLFVFLHAEAIGPVLLAKLETPLAALVVSDAAGLHLDVAWPVACPVRGDRAVTTDAIECMVSNQAMLCRSANAAAHDLGIEALSRLAMTIDPLEPLERIAEAVREVHTWGADEHGSAA